jgi:hypothetical protein
MDLAGASRTVHALRRPLGVAILVALLALAFATGSAHAQVQAPPVDVPDHAWDQPDAHVDPDGWNPDGDTDPTWPGWPGDGTGVPPAPEDPFAGDQDPYLPFEDDLPPVTTSYVAGKIARLRTDGKAAIPRGAPKRVRSLISQYNRIVGKRYKWGGGHAKLVDTGYDCSGAVGYGLIKNGLLSTTLVSGSFARWGASGPGRWVSVYANKTHVYTEVAGLRLDTSPVGDSSRRSGVRWRPAIGQRVRFKVRHPVGL